MSEYMRKLYDYCFYRISRFYEKYEGYGLFSGTLLVVGSVFWVLLAIIIVLSWSIFHYQPTKGFVIGYSVITVIIVYFISYKYDTDEKYQRLCKQYENEKHRTLKGWLVFLGFLLSLALLVLSIWFAYGR